MPDIKRNTFKSQILRAKCVMELMDLLKEFKDKADRYEAISNKLENEPRLNHTTEGKELKKEKLRLKEYLEKHITQFKKDKQEWFFEHVESKKETASA